MADDREQDRTEERDSAARPVTAAARRERRASARQSAAGPKDGRVEDRPQARPTGSARTRRAKADEDAASDTKAKSGATTPKKDRPTPERDRKDKRPSVFARFARFIREVVGELRKVIWPTRKQQITYTVVVLVFVAFIVALVSGLDLLFAKGVFWVFA